MRFFGAGAAVLIGVSGAFTGVAVAAPAVTSSAVATVVAEPAVDESNVTRSIAQTNLENGTVGPVLLQESAAPSGLAGVAADQDVLTVDVDGGSAASEATATSANNDVLSSGAESGVALTNSFSAFAGVATVQQDAGVANALAAATVTTVGATAGAVDAVAQSAGVVAGNRIETIDGDRRNSALGVWQDGVSGVVTLQQSSGSGSALSAATSVLSPATTDSAGNLAMTAVSQASVRDVTTVVAGGMRRNTLQDAFNDFSGVATIQQNTGDNSVLAAATAVAPASEAGVASPVLSTAELNAAVSGSVVRTVSLAGLSTMSYGNTISGSFNNFRGVVTIQQNSGSNSVLQSSIAVSGRF